jgi:phosphatidylinositol-3-phosphatase
MRKSNHAPRWVLLLAAGATAATFAACGNQADLGDEPDAGSSGVGGAGTITPSTGAGGATVHQNSAGGAPVRPDGAGGYSGSGGTGGGDAVGGGGGNGAGGGGPVGAGTTPPAASRIPYVFVISMENEPATAIYGSASAPYINGQLLPHAARSDAFADPLPDATPSEPHYVWMEAGTNRFSDSTFTTDSDPSSSNSTKNTAHIVTQMGAAHSPVSWLSYQEGLNASTGACPVRSSGLYVAKHDPFVFFQDVAGSPPSTTNPFCAAHHRAYTHAAFARDLQQKNVARYNFITPNICNDMHGGGGCPGGDVIRQGDDWLRTALPPIIDFVNANGGVIFLVWDEPVGGSKLIPFVAIGPHVKAGYTSPVAVTHSALTKSLDEIFGLPILPAVASANDLADMFDPGSFP